ncbi:MAG: hypothetical protein ACT4OS_12615 [Acidimicrobiales bacterium]
MERLIVRLWVPDRPGALGAVASRIGAVRGDVVGVEILERGGGRAIDELVVELPDASLVSLLVSEVAQVDGVDVEDVRLCSRPRAESQVAALTAAARVVAADGPGHVWEALAEYAQDHSGSKWAATLDLARRSITVAVGDPPQAAWLSAYVLGSGLGNEPAAVGAEDVLWAHLDVEPGEVFAMGRPGRPFRHRERLELGELCRIAALRRTETRAAAGGLVGELVARR